MVYGKFKKQGLIGRIADYLMLPVMYILQGNFSEVPQRTHRWNNLHLESHDIDGFDSSMIETVSGNASANRRWFGPIPLFHMPILGGWKEFVVLKPRHEKGDWFVGWLVEDAFGLSKIPIRGKVRLGIGPKQAQYFAIDREGKQIDIDIVGKGVIGDAGEFSKTPLL